MPATRAMRFSTHAAVVVCLLAAACRSSPCGDRVCDANETCSTCPQDCGPRDLVCDASQTCSSCPDDCGPCGSCGDGACSSAEIGVCTLDCGTALQTPTAVMNSGGTQVLVRGARQLSSVKFNSNCFESLAPETARQLGADPTCRWLPSGDFYIAVGQSSTLKPGGWLMFKGPGSQSRIWLSLAAGGLSPAKAVIKVRKTCTCDPLVLNGELSVGAGTQPLTYAWRLVSPTDAEVARNLSSTTGPRVALALRGGVAYTVELTVTDGFGQKDVATVTTSRSADVRPWVDIDGPLFRQVYQGSVLKLTAIMNEANCPGSTKDWPMASNNTWTVVPPLQQPLSVDESSFQWLQIPASRLQLGTTYTFTLTGMQPADLKEPWAHWATSSASVQVRAVRDPVQVGIYGGSRLMSLSSVTTLFPTFFPPTTETFLSAPYNWTCTDDTGKVVLQSLERSISFRPPNVGPTTCCVSTVIYERSTERCEVITGTDSTCEDFGVQPSNLLIGVNDKLTIRGLAVVSKKFKWTVTPTLPASAFLTNPSSDQILVVKPQVLTASSQYKFHFASADDSNQGFAEITIATAGAPFGGTFKMLSPSGTNVGVALTDLWSADFSGWKPASDEDGPLEYSLQFVSPRGNQVAIRWFAYQPHFENLRMPRSSNSDNLMEIIGVIRDRRGTTTSVRYSVTMTISSPSASIAIIDQVEREGYRTTYNPDLCVWTIASVIEGVDPNIVKNIDHLWIGAHPDELNNWNHSLVRQSYALTNTDLIRRSMAAMSDTLPDWSSCRDQLIQMFVQYVTGMSQTTLRIGMDQSRQLIPEVLKAYRSVVTVLQMKNMPYNDQAMIFCESIQRDIATHSNGEVVQYTSDVLNITNAKLRLADATFTAPSMTSTVAVDQASVATYDGEYLEFNLREFNKTFLQPNNTYEIVSPTLVALSVTRNQTMVEVKSATVTVQFNVPLAVTADLHCVWRRFDGVAFMPCKGQPQSPANNVISCSCSQGVIIALARGSFDIKQSSSGLPVVGQSSELPFQRDQDGTKFPLALVVGVCVGGGVGLIMIALIVTIVYVVRKRDHSRVPCSSGSSSGASGGSNQSPQPGRGSSDEHQPPNTICDPRFVSYHGYDGYDENGECTMLPVVTAGMIGLDPVAGTAPFVVINSPRPMGSLSAGSHSASGGDIALQEIPQSPSMAHLPVVMMGPTETVFRQSIAPQQLAMYQSAPQMGMYDMMPPPPPPQLEPHSAHGNEQ
eukprot:m51a1_g1739 hypothetical protein (1236) ;mRNA; f:174758-179342